MNNTQTITIEGKTYGKETLPRLPQENGETGTPDFRTELFRFLGDWYDERPCLTVHTSGSTGVPKALQVEKARMLRSARLTCDYLGLASGDTALLCMPLHYIAGKMMVARALERGLNLIAREPSGHPLADSRLPRLDFAAMVPLQVYNSLQVPAERERLANIGALLIGGGAIDRELEEKLRELPNPIYSSYGMTETLSHIALRRLNGSDTSGRYHPFQGVRLSLSPDNTLVIDAPMVCGERLVTNDIARLYPDGSFTIIGRKDNTVNSGGIKIQIEEVEEALRPLVTGQYAITAVPDKRLGEALTLLCEEEPPSAEALTCRLPRYWSPKHRWRVGQIPLTRTGKIDRAGCRKLAAKRLAEEQERIINMH